MKPNLVLAGLFLATLGGIGAESWIHRTFGIILPWERPRHIDFCGRRYDEGGIPLSSDAGAFIVTLRATIFDLPLPLPDLAETDIGLPYAGCPAQVVLELWDRDVLYGAIQGGP